MRFHDPFRDPDLALDLLRTIERISKGGRYTFMEVCGTHTMAMFRYGIRAMLPEGVRIISGPGCPVCVTPQPMIDKAIAYASRPSVRVPSGGSSGPACAHGSRTAPAG